MSTLQTNTRYVHRIRKSDIKQLIIGSPVYTPELISETIKTLALLLPENDEDLERWFETQQQKEPSKGNPALDPEARRCGKFTAQER